MYRLAPECKTILRKPWQWLQEHVSVQAQSEQSDPLVMLARTTRSRHTIDRRDAPSRPTQSSLGKRSIEALGEGAESRPPHKQPRSISLQDRALSRTQLYCSKLPSDCDSKVALCVQQPMHW
eukprot:1104207-Prymnesium_polylepis.2